MFFYSNPFCLNCNPKETGSLDFTFFPSSLKNAILTGGKYRLKPIIMTSLTTILALLPFLFFGGMGSELQKPLALTVIGGLFLGTFISLYFIPMMYGWMYKDQTTLSYTSPYISQNF